MKLYDANTDFSMFDLFTAKNNILDREVAAFRVTEKNIGTLAIHLGAELWYGKEDSPYVSIRCARANDVAGHVTVGFHVSDVLVFLNDEIHRFTKTIFEQTFTTDEVVEFRCTVCGKISGDNVDGAYGEKHAVATMVVDERPVRSILEDCNMDEKV